MYFGFLDLKLLYVKVFQKEVKELYKCNNVLNV